MGLPKCDVPDCVEPVVYVCMCRRCDSEPAADGKFWACEQHKNRPELRAKHDRIYPNHKLQLGQDLTLIPLRQAAQKEPLLQSIQQLIAAECDALKQMLLKKNESYGNSFAEPIGIFAKGLSADAQVRVRIDDKLSRLMRGSEFAGDDTALDLLGYLVLFRVLQKMEKKS